MLKVIVERDEDAINPRDKGYQDNASTMVCFHGRHNLGDDDHGYEDPNAFEEYCRENKVLRLPLYLYDHSGITINTKGFSCPFDSGQVGYIYMTYEQVEKEFGDTTKSSLAKSLKLMEGEVKEYDFYLTGEVYGYRIVEVDEDGEETDELDACWGFIGEESFARSEGEASMKELQVA